MSNFIINNGVLKKYTGTGGDVIIPDGVTKIGGNAFAGCSSLTSITIPAGLKTIGNEAFSGCESLTSITIPDSVVSIGNEAFSGCSSLASITIPNPDTYIGRYAFEWCGELTNINTEAKLRKGMFGRTTLTKPIVANDPVLLPGEMGRLAIIGYAEHPDAEDTPRKTAHMKYLESKAAKEKALADPALLQLMLDKKLLNKKMTDGYLQAAAEQQNTEATAMLLHYQQHTVKRETADTLEAKITEFVFGAEHLEPLQDETTVVEGALTTISDRA